METITCAVTTVACSVISKHLDAACSKAQASVPGHQIGRVHDFSPWVSAAMEAEKETKFGIKVA